MITLKVTPDELVFLNHVVWIEAIAGVFDFENNNDEEFVYRYGLTKSDVDKISKSLSKKIGSKFPALPPIETKTHLGGI